MNLSNLLFFIHLCVSLSDIYDLRTKMRLFWRVPPIVLIKLQHVRLRYFQKKIIARICLLIYKVQINSLTLERTAMIFDIIGINIYTAIRRCMVWIFLVGRILCIVSAKNCTVISSYAQVFWCMWVLLLAQVSINANDSLSNRREQNVSLYCCSSKNFFLK